MELGGKLLKKSRTFQGFREKRRLRGGEREKEP
jgi:hypothetical protein